MSQSLIGTAVGNYRVVDQLGEGGMGTVYKAIHPELDRIVAIKVLSLALSQTEDIVRRFRVEARAVNKIRHPNVVDVQDFGMLPDGRPYYVMEYLAGESLGGYVERIGIISPRDCLVIMIPVTEALEAAHNAGVVHRDLKPDNIFLLARPGQPPLPKLLDFGIAKVLSETIAGGQHRTQTGSLMGTPLYMSPEQAAGRVDELGPPSDVYSLGVILYQMLCGQPPFEAPGFGELLMMHMTATPAPLGSRVQGLPPVLEALVMRMLAKPAGERPRDAGAVRRELVAIANSLAVDANQPLSRAPQDPTIMAGSSNQLAAASGNVPAAASSGQLPPAIVSPVPGTVRLPVKTPGPSLIQGEVTQPPAPPSLKRYVIGAAATVVVALVAIMVLATRKDDAAQPTAAPPPADARVEIAPVAVDAYVPPVDAALPDAPPDADVPLTEREKKLLLFKEMYETGRISKREYDELRRKVLNEM